MSTATPFSPMSVDHLPAIVDGFDGVERSRPRAHIATTGDDWARPLHVRLPDHERILIVRGTRQAAALLAEKWPVTYGAAFERALSACAAVSEGRQLPDAARDAFIDAAGVAGVEWLEEEL